MAFLTSNELAKMNFKYLGNNVRISDKASIYTPHLISIDDNSRIDDFCTLFGKISIGKFVHVAVYCNISSDLEEGVEMHDFSGLAYGVNLISQSDDYKGNSLTNPNIPIEFRKVTRKKIIIEKHVIVGTNSVVLPGVKLSEGSSVGAMSLVNKDTEAWSVNFGIPTKKISNRSKDMLKIESDFLQWFELNKR